MESQQVSYNIWTNAPTPSSPIPNTKKPRSHYVYVGYLATTTSEFAEGFEQALSLTNPLTVRQRARISARRFTEEEFAKKWTAQMEKLIAMKS